MANKVVDLTMPIDENTPVYPGDPKPRIWQECTIKEHGFNELKVEMSLHFGTHIDAPLHMIEGGKSITAFPAEKFIGDAIVIDARKRNEKHEIIVDLKNIRKGDIVFFYTGQSEKAGTREFYKDIPIVSTETAKELVARGAKIVGLDSYTPDNPPFQTHKMLLSAEILIVENLVNLESLVGKKFGCVIAPLKINDADGVPCRVFALLK